MDKWEYKVEEYTFVRYVPIKQYEIDKLNELGKEGWELVATTQVACIFKRKVK